MRFLISLKPFPKLVLINWPYLRTSIQPLCAKSHRWRVIYYGTDFSECLIALNNNRLTISSERVVESLSVVCKNVDCKVRRYAIENNLTIHTWPYNIPLNTYDVGVVNGFGHLIPSQCIHACKYGMINLHPSLLPRWRGAAPVHHTILNGDRETGVTIMQIAPEKFDVGNILLQETFKVPDKINAKELSHVLMKKGSEMIMKTLQDLPHFINSSYPQTEEGVTYAPKLKRHQGRIDWDEDTMEIIQRKFNTFMDMFPVFTYWKDKKVILKNCLDKEEVETVNIPSFITLDTPSGFLHFHKELKILFVKCKDGWCGVVTVTVSQYGKMSASRFYKGFIKKNKNDYFK